MRVLTIIELMWLTRMQLGDLRLRIIRELDAYPEGSYEREAALTTLRNIATVLSRRDFSP